MIVLKLLDSFRGKKILHLLRLIHKSFKPLLKIIPSMSFIKVGREFRQLHNLLKIIEIIGVPMVAGNGEIMKAGGRVKVDLVFMLLWA